MGKKGSWFSAIKRVFTPKEKLVNGSDKKSGKERKGRGILKHGETKSFIPLFRAPSSIEKILGEADQQNLLVRPPTPSGLPTTPPIFSSRPASPPPPPPHRDPPQTITSFRDPPQTITSTRDPPQTITSTRDPPQTITSTRDPPQTITSIREPPQKITSFRDPPQTTTSIRDPPQRITSPRAPSARVTSPRAPSPRVASPRVVRQHSEISYRPEPTLRHHHLSATKIQSAYRGYMARRSFRALRGLVRLQGVVRGNNVKRQTMNAMKHMQLLVRVQTQIQSRRIQMSENQRQTYKNEKELESTLSKWTLNQQSEAGDNEDWDDSVITKEEREARMQRKVEALIKRERAMAYAYSHKLWKGNQKSPQPDQVEIRAGQFPWMWNWLERQLPQTNPSETRPTKNTFLATPSRTTPERKPSPRPQTSNSKISTSGFENLESQTPRSTRSTVPVKTRQFSTTPSRTPPSSSLMKFFKPRGSPANSTYDLPMKDDDSLMSCPPFSSVPNYMSPTVSAKAKVRPNSTPKDRFPGTPSSDPKRRFSFPLTPNNIGSFKGSSKDSTTSQRVLDQNHHQRSSPRSVGEFSVDSAISMPATVGRKAFNRFV